MLAYLIPINPNPLNRSKNILTTPNLQMEIRKQTPVDGNEFASLRSREISSFLCSRKKKRRHTFSNTNSINAKPKPLDPNPKAWKSYVLSLRWTPDPVIVTTRDSRDYFMGSSNFPMIPLLQGGGSS